MNELKTYPVQDKPISAKDFQRKFFYGGKTVDVPEEFDHSLIFDSNNQGMKMDCVFESTVGHAAIKYFLATGKKLVINTDVAWQLAMFAPKFLDEDGDPLFDEKRGAYTHSGLETMRKMKGFQFINEDGDWIEAKVAEWFFVEDYELDEEIYKGGSVISGISSRIGISIADAKYSPYFATAKKANKNDGHCIIKAGKKRAEWWRTSKDKIAGLIEHVLAYVIKNSYGVDWGDNGRCYIDTELNKKTFRNIGSTMSFTNVTQAENEAITERVFKDVGNDSWFSGAVIKAGKTGIIQGFEDGTFRPGQPVNRAQLAVILDRCGLLDK